MGGGARPHFMGSGVRPHHRVEYSGQIGVVVHEIPTVKEAVEKFVSDGQARNLTPESVKKVKDVIERGSRSPESQVAIFDA